MPLFKGQIAIPALTKGRPENRDALFVIAQLVKPSTYPILFSSGTISRETMLMILIIGLTAGPAVSL